MPQGDVSSLYAQVRRRLIESGEWDQLRAVMHAKLNEAGWCDEIHHKSKEVSKTIEPLSFKALHAKVAPQAENSVPLAVKRELSSLIRQHIEKQFE
ncbi:Transcription and mRNA export factor SUS1 [Psilocybe cubensis]|uniref:Transcription and mRNA export factor SUS1 n=2 Tax=Psilocybe cubensis TaxID=181762 RepID=A0ACB8GIN9_PSICU|nr:Transcription and mRNA export factor SUS1 [Psilocybe cubensis]KAH9475364.1 Transcription and mRNA export factor SUS1 [Psilocybe cubensis]